mgnify:FL=1
MKKILLVVALYPDHIQSIYNKHISPRNREYATKHNYEYIEITKKEQIKQSIHDRRSNPSWTNFLIYEDWLDNNFIEEGDKILSLDADMYIVDMEKDLCTDKSFSYSIDSGNTHCMGWHSLTINNWSKKLISNIVSDERYEKLKHIIHPNSGTSFWEMFSEQASWYSLAGVTMHSNVSYFNIDNFGWNTDTQQLPLYTTKELHKNIEIRDTAYNVTEWPGESNCDYNINKLDNADQVILRHFVSGQLWNNESLINNWKK